MIGRGEAPRVVVLASGAGSNFEALARASESGEANLRIEALVTDRPSAGCLSRAKSLGIVGFALPASGRPRREYDRALADLVSGFSPDWILLLGWMRILSADFLSRFPERVINLHPALPGAFPGRNAIERAWTAIREGLIDRTGAMIHFVPDEGVDSGPVILKEEIPAGASLSLAELESKVHETEHRLVRVLAARLGRYEIAAGGTKNKE